MKLLKRYLYDIVIVMLFAAISYAYFMPADLEGRILYRHDASAGRGAGVEADQYYQTTGERTRWTNALFSGMPTYQTAPSYDSTDLLSKVMNAYHLWLPENVWYVFVYLLGFYILLRAFNFRKELAAMGSILWAFSSYFFIIIAAGHIWKVWALAYLPPMIAGMVYAFRGNYLRGLVLLALFSAFEIKANHIQMTYYFLFVILLMWLAYLEQTIRNKNWAHFGKATAVCVVGALIGISINASTLYHTWQYSKESNRGASALSATASQSGGESTQMSREYITAWSYGVDETLTLLIPNTKGGASFPLTMNQKAMSKANPEFYTIYQQLGQYWGEQPGTSGPVYVGALVFMLFILSWFIVKGPIKWALLGATALSIVLAWGHNFMAMTDFFLDYVPMYDKFRTVASILVVAEFTIPLLAMMALKELTEKWQTKWVISSYALTAGICVFFALCPGIFDFISSSERSAINTLPQEYIAPLIANLEEMRKAVFTADCWRSFWIITIGVAILLWQKHKPEHKKLSIIALALLCLVDMWGVNKRYLYDDMFVARSQRELPQTMTETDAIILQDTDPNYRVLNLASNTFNENETSYYHKSIGGYHAAKLGRYQDLIENHLQYEMRALFNELSQGTWPGELEDSTYYSPTPVLDMLNTKYFILPISGGETMPLQNPYAMGNAWFAEDILIVNSAQEELEALAEVDLWSVAVSSTDLDIKTPGYGETELTSYQPNELKYNVNGGGLLVFSELYYPGWSATVDGTKTEIYRVNYLLRAIKISEGEHEVVLTFKPKSITVTETIAYIALTILLLTVLYIIFKKV